MTTSLRVVVAGALPPTGLDLLRTRFLVEAGSDRADGRWLVKHARAAVAIVTDPSIRVDQGVLDAAGDSLKVISSFGVGYDHIDLDAARTRGVRVTNTPGVVTTATAELAVGLMLSTARRIVEADAIVRAGRWADLAPEQLLGRELAGATVGLVGFGRIGRRVADLVRAFDARVLFSSRTAAPAVLGVERRELPELLAASDFVSLHLPLTPDTTHLIDARALEQMKPGAILVNTSRGGVLDTAALIEALRSRALAAAGLDVYEDEPGVPAELRELPNTVLLPHIGTATATTRDAMARLCVENVVAVIEGREPPAAVL